ncbi:MAG: DUF3108 domain-containing protein [Paludibacteraceae bacterium]|nr:DUF3108 domain-containing protein [Paludibacteraceae bacterium]
MNIKHIITLIIAMVLSAGNIISQVSYVDTPVFKVGEKATYGIYFNLGFISMKAGKVHFEVGEAVVRGEDCYKLMVNGYTQGMFERFYVVRDTFTSYISKKTLQPVYYHDGKHEDSYWSYSTYLYTDNGKADSLHVNFEYIKRKGTSRTEFNISKKACDLVATCYKIRNLDVASMSRGDVAAFSLLFEDIVYELGLKFTGKENVKLKDGSKYRTSVFVPTLIKGDLFKNDEDLKVYVADDDNHYPVYVEASLKMGKAVASLESISGTKYEQTGKKKKK